MASELYGINAPIKMIVFVFFCIVFVLYCVVLYLYLYLY